MKKHYLILITLLLASFTCLNAQDMVNITFNVNMANETTSPDGVFLAGGGADCFGDPGQNPMTDDDGDDIWTITVMRPVGFSCAYTFTNGNCPDYSCKESIVGLECAVGEFSDRFLEAVAGDTVINTCFSQCSTDGTCEAAADPVTVTFNVDVNEETVGAEDGVFIFGNAVNGWCADCTPMEDADADGVYTITLEMAPGPVEYKFLIGAADEMLDPGIDAECTLTSGAFTNRFLTVGEEDIVLDDVCFGSCALCEDAVAPTDVTFRVDMSNVEDAFSIPEVNGTFNGWCGNCNPLTDEGDGIWSTTISLAPATYDYKFSADAWTIQEDLVDLSDCAISDDGTNWNRRVEVGAEPITLDVVCWGTCAACVSSVTEINGSAFKVFPNPTSGEVITVEGNLGNSLEIYNSLGAVVLRTNIPAGVTKYQLDISELSRGTYFIKEESGVALGTFVVTK